MSNRLACSFVVVGLASSVLACGKQQDLGNPPAPPSSATGGQVAPQAALPTLKPGDTAPALVATASNGSKIDLATFAGKSVVVYFYPKDDTPGCTKEANGFKESFAKLQENDIVVIGVSEQDDASHQAFAQKYELPFALVADTDGAIAQRFGVPVTNGHAARMSFLVDKQGKIKKVYPKVDPSVHTAEILSDATS